MSLASLVADKRILVCVGAGGVGKTTTAATLALAGARSGRRTLVLTIDPAKRLANALGLPALGHDIAEVSRDRIGGDSPGQLFAMMLDQKRSFDEVVARYTRDPATLKRILDNRIYRQISSALAGSHEFAAMAKLYEVTREGDYDLIVLDTPPTSNALDFLDAPERMSAAVDSPAIKWFTVKAAGAGAAFVLRRLSRFVGSAFLDDVAAFLVEFNTILGGFRERAQEVFSLLRGPQVAFILVSSAEALSIDEALYFYDRLVDSKMPLGAFVVNRVRALGPEALSREALVDALAAEPATGALLPDDIVQLAADVERSYREHQLVATADAAEIARLVERTRPSLAPIVSVPRYSDDVFDTQALLRMVDALTSTSAILLR